MSTAQSVDFSRCFEIDLPMPEIGRQTDDGAPRIRTLRIDWHAQDLSAAGDNMPMNG